VTTTTKPWTRGLTTLSMLLVTALVFARPALAAVCGDANEDDVVTSVDALAALGAAVDLHRCAAFRCDVNADGQIAASDALAILRRAVGLGIAFECPPDRRLLATGSEPLIRIFASDSMIWVVDGGGVRRFASNGTLDGLWEAPRPLLTATMEGPYLVVADGAKFTTLAASTLAVVISAITQESCYSLAVVSGPRVVCGPANDWQRIFYTYDALTGALLAQSQANTYNGIPMLRVPGFDGFVTPAGSNFTLYRVDPDSDRVEWMDESPYFDVTVTWKYVFDGDPAQNLINQDGDMLEIHTPDCVESSCFTLGENLGTTGLAEHYAAIVQSGSIVAGVIARNAITSSQDSNCEKGCRLNAVVAASRQLVSGREIVLPIGDVVSLAATPEARVFVFGGYDPDERYPSDRTDYSVWWVEME